MIQTDDQTIRDREYDLALRCRNFRTRVLVSASLPAAHGGDYHRDRAAKLNPTDAERGEARRIVAEALELADDAGITDLWAVVRNVAAAGTQLSAAASIAATRAREDARAVAAGRQPSRLDD